MDILFKEVMSDKIQGSITARISNDEMVAYLDYAPSQVLTEWSNEIILKLLKEKGIVKGYKEFHFSRILKKIKQSDEATSYVIAKGLKPVTISNSLFKFNFKELPASLQSVYEELNNGSAKPVVYPLDAECFLEDEPQKMSVVVFNVYYVGKGDIVGEINDNAKAQDGYTVTGSVLSPDKEDVGLPFCLSKDFKIDKNLLLAEKSGFIRRGKNWLDILPFEGHKYELFPSDDFAEYFLSFTPGCADAPLPLFDDILELFSDIDYPLSLLKDETTILALLQRGINEKRSIKISLSKKREVSISLDINPSKTRATLILKKGAGPGQKLSLKVVGALIRESQIKGMNLDNLKTTILEFYKSHDLSLEYLVIEGKVATRGEDRRLDYKKEFVCVGKIESIVNRINDDITAFYPSFKEFPKDSITSTMLVGKGFEFATLTEASFGDDGIDIYGNKIKGQLGNDPIIKTFENITIKQDKYISDIDGILDVGEIDGQTFLRVREHKDMFVDVVVSKDLMSACFTFYKSRGSGEPASLDFINKQIDEAGVVKGIDSTVIEESLEKFQSGELISEVLFAKGQIPTDNKSSLIKYTENNGRNQFSYEVEKGVQLAQIFPSKDSSEDGFDVLGTIMESSGVASLNLDIGDFIEEEKLADGSTILKATSNGEFKVDNNSITIVDKKVLDSDVSVKTGSIKTLCSLVIKGGVMSSLYVVSGGNIKILGTVQGALVSADKNIIIAQGVKGEDKAVLRAKEKIDVKFIESANMMAVNDIHIRKAALHTKIISNGKVLLDKGGSKLVGGEMFSRKGLVVDEVGSPSGGVTKISFGQDYLVADKIKVFEKDIDKIQQDLLKIDHILHKPSGHISSGKITHLRKQKVFLMKKLEKKNMKLFLLREKFEEHSASEIVVRDKIHQGVIFESHGRILEILDQESACKIFFNLNTGQIEKTRT